MNEPIRILHVFGRLNRGGAETLMMNLYRFVDRKKIQFDFVKHTNDICIFDEEIVSLGGRIHNISQYYGKNHFKYLAEWRNLLLRHPEYKIIHGHMRSTAALYLKICRDYDRITIAHSHATGSRGNLIERNVKNIMQLPIRYVADYFFACSIPAAKWLFGNLSALKTIIFKNTIDLELYRFDLDKRNQFRKEYFENKLVIGHIGSFTKPKNYSFLVDVFKEILIRKDNAVLVLVGDGELRKEVEAEVKLKKIENKVHFLGSRSDVPNILMGMDIFIFPSLFEGFGISALESQAVGLPTHVSDRLPNEIKVSEQLYFHSLKMSPTQWAIDILKNFVQGNRNDNVEKIKNLGYDIREQANYLMNFYLKISK